jgi:hypothetical protein
MRRGSRDLLAKTMWRTFDAFLAIQKNGGEWPFIFEKSGGKYFVFYAKMEKYGERDRNQWK